MRKKADNKTIRKRLENSWVFWVVLLLLPIVLLGIRELWLYRYCDQCLENWGNEKFISYTGQCTEVYFDSGFEGFTRYGWLSKREYQDFTGQGWHLILDNGRGYYIPEVWENNMPLCNQKSLNALEGETVTVLCRGYACNGRVDCLSGALVQQAGFWRFTGGSDGAVGWETGANYPMVVRDRGLHCLRSL